MRGGRRIRAEIAVRRVPDAHIEAKAEAPGSMREREPQEIQRSLVVPHVEGAEPDLARPGIGEIVLPATVDRTSG